MKQSGAVLLAAAFLLAGCGGRAAAVQTASHSERMSEEHRESGSQAAQEQGKADTEKTERVKTGDAGEPEASAAAKSTFAAEEPETLASSGGAAGASGEKEEAGSALPGSYTTPEGWVKAEQYSTDEKIFYVEKGHENDRLPDNISINVGNNRYSEEEHMAFRDAIVRQLIMQLKDQDAQLNANGSFTEQGYVVYTFMIEKSDAVMTQYYIVGDHRYCMVYLSNYSRSEGPEQAARTMVDSFVWD